MSERKPETAHIEIFANWEEAFSFCRERRTPIIVQVNDEQAKVYPSGAYKAMSKPARAPAGGEEKTR